MDDRHSHIYEGSTVTLYVDLYDSGRDSPITDPAEVSFEVRPPESVPETLTLTAGGVTPSPDTPSLYIAHYQALAAGRYTVIARAESVDGHRVVSVETFSVRPIPRLPEVSGG